MANGINRRKALAGGTAAIGGIIGLSNGCSREPVEKESRYINPGRESEPVKNLSVGKSAVRLASFGHRLDYPGQDRITEMVRSIRDAGYTAASCHTSIGHRNQWLDVPDAEISELKEALKTYDVDPFDVMIWTNLIHPDSRTRQTNLAYAAENIEAAERIGARMVTAVTGSCDPDYYIAAHLDNWSEGTWKLTVESIRQLLRDTSGMKASLGVEAVVTTNIDGPAAHKRLMEDVGDERCRVCLDPINMTSLANAYHTTETLDECFNLLGESILGCHAKDVIIERDRMLLHLTESRACTGLLDYETYLTQLSRMQWPRTLLIEHIPADQYAVAKGDIIDIAEHLGVTIHGT